jgi:antitoxin MazE
MYWASEGGTQMRVIVRKWGNSASARIPAAVMQAARVSLDTAVDVREEDGRIVIVPERAPQYSLAALLKNITPENLHDPIELGEPLGQEAL